MSRFEQRTPGAAEVKAMARECGIDAVGIASIESFKEAPPAAHPCSIQAHARSVIAFAHRIPRGSLRGAQTGKTFRSLTMNSPVSYGITKTYQFCCKLESAGWEAVPMYPHTRDVRGQGVPVSDGRPAPDVVLDAEFVAHAAGLGEMGRGGWFLTREFGPRQFFTFVITDLELEPDASVAEGSICDACGACAAACPVQALNPDELMACAQCRGTGKTYKLELPYCRVCEMTANLKPPFDTGKQPWRLGAACALACVEHLEDGGRLTRRFHRPFGAGAEVSAC